MLGYCQYSEKSVAEKTDSTNFSRISSYLCRLVRSFECMSQENKEWHSLFLIKQGLLAKKSEVFL